MKRIVRIETDCRRCGSTDNDCSECGGRHIEEEKEWQTTNDLRELRLTNGEYHQVITDLLRENAELLASGNVTAGKYMALERAHEALIARIERVAGLAVDKAAE